MARYSNETRERAIAALWGSALLSDGQWEPNFQAAAKAVDIPLTTVRRWWIGRDVARDGYFRSLQAAGAEKAAERGDSQWRQAMRSILDKRMDELLKDNERWADTPVDRAAKAMQFISQLLDSQDAKTGDTSTRDDRVSRYKKAAAAAKVDP